MKMASKVVPAVCLALATVSCTPASNQAAGNTEASLNNDASQETDAIQATNSVLEVPVGPRREEIRTKTTFKPLLPAERTLLEGDSLSVAKASPMLKSEKNFDQFIENLKNEAARDPLAQDLTSAQREKLAAAFPSPTQLRSFACGLSVCGGVVALGAAPEVYDQFAKNFLESGPARTSLLDYRVDMGGGQFAQRFVIAVDPTVQGIIAPARPRPN